MKENVKEITCVKFGASMSSGYLVEQDPDEFIHAGMGLYWIPMRRWFDAFKTVALIAYACPECGYVEQYVRRIEQDREKILLVPISPDRGENS